MMVPLLCALCTEKTALPPACPSCNFVFCNQGCLVVHNSFCLTADKFYEEVRKIFGYKPDTLYMRQELLVNTYEILRRNVCEVVPPCRVNDEFVSYIWDKTGCDIFANMSGYFTLFRNIPTKPIDMKKAVSELVREILNPFTAKNVVLRQTGVTRCVPIT